MRLIGHQLDTFRRQAIIGYTTIQPAGEWGDKMAAVARSGSLHGPSRVFYRAMHFSAYARSWRTGQSCVYLLLVFANFV